MNRNPYNWVIQPRIIGGPLRKRKKGLGLPKGAVVIMEGCPARVVRHGT